MNDHDRIRDALLDGERDEAHLAECEECRSLDHALRAVDASFGELPSIDVPPEVVQRTLARIEDERPGVLALLAAVAQALLGGLFAIGASIIDPFRARRRRIWLMAGTVAVALVSLVGSLTMTLGSSRSDEAISLGIVEGRAEMREYPAPNDELVASELATEDEPAVDDGVRRQLDALGYAPVDHEARARDTIDDLSVDGRFEDSHHASDFWQDEDGFPDFVEPRGYWANTYTPGDPALRALRRELEGAPLALAERATPADLGIDAPTNAALALELGSDLAAVSERTRMLLSVGLRAIDARGRRPTLTTQVVIDARTPLDDDARARIRALLTELSRHRQPADRIGVIVAGPGGGQLVPMGELRFGELSVALRRLGHTTGAELALPDALRTAIESVGTADAVSSALVLVVTPSLRDDGRAMSLAQIGALAGVTTSAIGLADDAALDDLALAGHGRRRTLRAASDAATIVRGETEAMSRIVARAVRVRIRLAPGVSLVDVLGSRRLDVLETQQVREQERALDTELARALGIAADRGADEDGIQIVIPAFYAGDEHAILLDVVAGSGPVADVSLRYKDLVHLQNATASGRFTLGRGEETPRERAVRAQRAGYETSRAFAEAAQRLDNGDRAGARAALDRARAASPSDAELCTAYAAAIDSAADLRPLASSLRYASYRRRNGDPLALE